MSIKINTDKFKNRLMKYIPESTKVGLISISLSMVTALITSALVYYLSHDKKQVFYDIVVDYMGYFDDNKYCDFYAYYTFMIVYVISFFIISRIANIKYADIINKHDKIKVFHILIALLPNIGLWLLHKGWIHGIPLHMLIFIAFYIIHGLVLFHLKITHENVLKLLLSFFYIYLSLSGIFALLTYLSPNLADDLKSYFSYLLFILYACVDLVIYITIKKHRKNIELAADILIYITQLIIPLVLFCIINTRYIYKGNHIDPINHNKFKLIIIIFSILLIISHNVHSFNWLKTKECICNVSISTIISYAAVLLWNGSYNLLIITDPAHTGEVEVVYNQIINMGQKWNTEFVSMLQGLGFVLSALNQLVFGGTFATFVHNQNLLLLIIVTLVAIAFYSVFDKQHRWLLIFFMPVVPLFLLNRAYLVGLVFVFLVNPKIIMNPIKWTYCYILTCIIHVWYQPTYGGAVAASLFPVLLLLWYNAFKRKELFINKIHKNKLIIFFISIIVIGICCIPLLLQALHFLKVNGYETINGNGITLKQSIQYGINTLTNNKIIDTLIYIMYKFGSGLFACAIMLYMFVRYVLKDAEFTRKIQGVVLTVSAVISFVLLLPASFTRIDTGVYGVSRIGAISFIYLSCLLVLLFYFYRNKIENKPIAIIVCGLLISAGFYVSTPDYFGVHDKVNSVVQIPDSAKYVTPDETGLDKLGYAFVDNEEYLQEAVIINEICNALLSNNQTYFDFTDKSIYYNYANKKVPGLYVAETTLKSYYTQSEAIKQLQKNDIPIIFINKPMTMLPSISAYRIYRYFMQQDYRFINYKGVDFLVRNDIDLTPIQNDIDINSIEKTLDTTQIDEKLYNSTLLDSLDYKADSFINNIEIKNDSLYTCGTDPFVVLKLNQNVNMEDVDLIEINYVNKPVANMKGQLFIQTETIEHNQENSVQFSVESNKVTIPVYILKQFSVDGKLLNLRLDFDDIGIGTDVTIKSINLYHLSKEQKEELENHSRANYDLDNRLDDAFHRPNLEHLAHEWGESFNYMRNRFKETESMVFKDTQVQVSDTPVSLHIDIERPLLGSKGEFLRIKLNYNDEKKRLATVIVKGIDKKGRTLNEEFNFITVSDNMLIPIASSPNCYQAQELTGLDIVLYQDVAPYNVEIDEAALYQLIQ